MAGDRVELACDVSSTLQHDYHHQGDDVAAAAILARSPAFKRIAGAMTKTTTTLSSGLAARARYLRNAGPSSRLHQMEPEHHHQLRRGRSRRYNNHHRHNAEASSVSAADDDAASETDAAVGVDTFHHEQAVDGGYLVLWFFEPERKPFYRYK